MNRHAEETRHLCKIDPVPIDDFGLRNGFRIVYGHVEMPTPQQGLDFGERWWPYRTAAAWYLWRASEGAKVIRPTKLMLKNATKRASDG